MPGQRVFGQESFPVDRDGHGQKDGDADKEAEQRRKFVQDFTGWLVVFGHKLVRVLVERYLKKRSKFS